MLITRENDGKMETEVYRKPTHTDQGYYKALYNTLALMYILTGMHMRQTFRKRELSEVW